MTLNNSIAKDCIFSIVNSVLNLYLNLYHLQILLQTRDGSHNSVAAARYQARDKDLLRLRVRQRVHGGSLQNL